MVYYFLESALFILKGSFSSRVSVFEGPCVSPEAGLC